MFDQTYLTTNNSYSGNDPKYIVIHNTGNYKPGATAQAHASSLRNGYIDDMSWHIVVDDKDIFQCLPWNRGAWHVGVNYGGRLFGMVNNRNSICIEMCVNEGYDYEKAFQNTVRACRMVMQELGIPADHVYRHYDVCAKNCPSEIMAHGDWARFKKLIGAAEKEPEKKGTQAAEFAGLSEAAAAVKILDLVYDCDNSGILPSVTAAQMILESGYVTTDLARNANNVFGMKCTLSGNTWPGSTWDGKSKYTKKTQEQTASGSTYYKEADFRKYPCIEDSIADHAAYLLGAKNGSKLRYAGLTECTDYEAAIKLIKAGGYATDTKYVDKICSIIRRFGLARYDAKKGEKIVAKTTVQKAIDWALATAKDNSHGYNNAKGARTGPDYACSSFIAAAWRAAGLTSIPADAYTATMRGQLLAAGFEDVSSTVNLKTGKGMIPGDVVLLPGKHVEMVVDDKHRLVRARGNAFTGAENGKAGDQTGEEISVKAWFNYGWRFCLRYTKEENKETQKKTTYIVQAGAYSVKANAQKQLVRVKKVVPDAFIKETGGQYRIQAGSFSSKANAETRKKLLIGKGISAIIKTE